MFCSGCGKEVVAGTSFCRWCGQSVVLPQPRAVTAVTTVAASVSPPKNRAFRPWHLIGAVAVLGLLVIWVLSLSEPPTSASGGVGNEQSKAEAAKKHEAAFMAARKDSEAKAAKNPSFAHAYSCYRSLTSNMTGENEDFKWSYDPSDRVALLDFSANNSQGTMTRWAGGCEFDRAGKIVKQC